MVDESSIKYRLCSIIDQLWSINLKGGCPWAMSGDGMPSVHFSDGGAILLWSAMNMLPVHVYIFRWLCNVIERGQASLTSQTEKKKISVLCIFFAPKYMRVG